MTEMRVQRVWASEQSGVIEVQLVGNEGSIHRDVYLPGDDLENAPETVREKATEVWTDEVIAAHMAKQAPEPLSSRRIGSPREFLHLFTDAEKAAFFTAEAENVQLKMWWAEASTGDFSLDHPSVALGLASLVAAGILTQIRADEIANADFNESA